MHQKHPFHTRKGDDGFSQGSASPRKGDDGFNPRRIQASKGDTGFRRAGRLVYRTHMRYPWPVAGPGRATSGRPTLQTSSNQHDLNRLARTSVTNVVNLSPKTSIFTEKADGLTTFVTTRAKPDLSTPGPTGVKGAGGICRGAGGRRRGLAGLRGDAPSRRLAARTASGQAAAQRHTQRPGPPAHGTPVAPDNGYDSETSPRGSRKDRPR